MLAVARAFRIILCVVAGAVLAAGVRDHRRPEAGEVVSDLMDVPAGERAGAVLEGLEEAGPGGLAAAFEMLDDPSPQVRAGAAAYLGRRGSRRAVPHLIRRLRDDDRLVRLTAARALGAIADPRALPFLERALGSDHLDVAEAALLAARRIRAIQGSDLGG